MLPSSLRHCTPQRSAATGMNALKQELKQWEYAFREKHGRDAAKADIKQDQAIAEKYRIYNKSKTASSSTRHPPAPAPTTTTTTTTNPVFRTPTKPKPAPSNPALSGTPTLSSLKSPSKPTYVVANSPSKLRALAASHSRSSPNYANSPNHDATTGSPRKFNPFRAGSDAGGGEGSDDAFFDSPRGGAASRQSNGRANGEKSAGARAIEMMSVGPSPVKPAASGRPFKPLLDVPLAPPKLQPKLFETSVKHLQSSSKGSSSSSSSSAVSNLVPSNQHPTLATSSRGVKRPSTSSTLAFDSGMPGDEESTATEAKAGGGKKKAPAKPRARKGKKARLLAPAGTEDVEMDDSGSTGEIKRRREKGALILEMEEEEGKVDTVVIHPRRPYWESRKGKEKEEKAMVNGRGGRVDEMDHDANRGDLMHDEEEEAVDDAQGSLFYRDNADLLSSQDASRPFRADPPSSDDLEDSSSHQNEQDDDDMTIRHLSYPAHQHSITIDSTIPSELVSMLEIRSSPIKKTALLREKDRDLRVKKLLQEPSVKGKQKLGLQDLEERERREEEMHREEEEEGSDEDWDSDPEGWKDLGRGEMDEEEEKWGQDKWSSGVVCWD